VTLCMGASICTYELPLLSVHGECDIGSNFDDSTTGNGTAKYVASANG
jgi:hypothetical protein